MTVKISNLPSGQSIAWAADNTGDIGASGANRPRSGYFGANLVAGDTITGGGGATGAGSIFTGGLYYNGRGYISAAADGVFTLKNEAGTDFGRLQFGGTTSSYPALGRSGTSLQVLLADGTSGGTLNVTGGLIQSGGTSLISAVDTYTRVFDPGTNRAAFLLGNAGDPSNYYDNDSHLFRTRSGATVASISNTVLQIGANSATPSAQTFVVQSVSSGTADTAGVAFTLTGSKSTGSGAPGDIIFQTAGKGAASTTQNTLITALTIKGGTTNNTNVGYPSVVIGTAALATTATDGFLYIPTCAGTPSGTPTTQTGRIAMVYDTSAHQFWFYDGGWKQPKTPAGAAIVTWQ